MSLTPPSSETDAVAFDEVTFSYRRTPLFENLTWRVPKGRFIDLLGPNGSGKTTLRPLAMADKASLAELIHEDAKSLIE